MVASSQLMSFPLCQILSVFWMGIKTPYENELQRGGGFLRQGTSRRELNPRYRPLYPRAPGLQAPGFRPQTSDLRPQTSDLRPQTSDLRPQSLLLSDWRAPFLSRIFA